MSAMKRVFPLFLVASLLTVVASCVGSRNPASDEKTSKIDERLIGEWNVDGDSVWKATKSKDVENALDVDAPKPKGPGHVLVFATTIKSQGYLSIINVKDKKSKEASYLICRYEFSDNDTVNIRFMKPKALAKAIQEKQIIGEMVKKDNDKKDTPVITDTPEGIARYLEAHADECFTGKNEVLTCKRRK